MSRIWAPFLDVRFWVTLRCLGSFPRFLPGGQQIFPSEPCPVVTATGAQDSARRARCLPLLFLAPSYVCLLLMSVPQALSANCFYFVHHLQLLFAKGWFIRTSLPGMKPWKSFLTFRIIYNQNQRKRACFIFKCSRSLYSYQAKLYLPFHLWHFMRASEEARWCFEYSVWRCLR